MVSGVRRAFLGIQKGISKSSDILMPVLVVMFVALVVYSLFLPGAEKGLNALFTPDWSKLSNTERCGLRLTVKSSSLFPSVRDYDYVCIVLEKRFRFNW